MIQKLLLVLMIFLLSCTRQNQTTEKKDLTGDNWAEKLGYPVGKRVLMFHADDIGMCPEANESAVPYLLNDEIQSAAVMMPCPSAEEFVEWYKQHPNEDVGVHLTLTSEWSTYRWAPITDAAKVPGLIDSEGFIWRDVMSVVKNASPEEVEKEVRAQIDKFISAGIRPGHIDTHMGTLYGSLGFAKAYLNVAMDYGIPAMAIEFTMPVLERFRAQGYPITDEMVAFASGYTLPKLDDFYSVPNGKSYAEKRANFFEMVKSLKPGITEMIFHPSVESDNLKAITNSWQQRVWEAQLFSDPEVKQFLKDEGILFTNWKEMMTRFKERT
jgi:chitin disaccharide deacetylase